MRSLILTVFLITTVSAGLSACTVSHGTAEQRVVVLPTSNPDTSLATAQKICEQVASEGIAAKVHERFPSLTEQQLRGIILRPTSGYFSETGQSTFITTGFYYEGSVPDAKAVADYVESIVRAAVVARLGSAQTASPS